MLACFPKRKLKEDGEVVKSDTKKANGDVPKLRYRGKKDKSRKAGAEAPSSPAAPEDATEKVEKKVEYAGDEGDEIIESQAVVRDCFYTMVRLSHKSLTNSVEDASAQTQEPPPSAQATLRLLSAVSSSDQVDVGPLKAGGPFHKSHSPHALLDHCLLLASKEFGKQVVMEQHTPKIKRDPNAEIGDWERIGVLSTPSGNDRVVAYTRRVRYDMKVPAGIARDAPTVGRVKESQLIYIGTGAVALEYRTKMDCLPAWTGAEHGTVIVRLAMAARELVDVADDSFVPERYREAVSSMKVLSRSTLRVATFEVEWAKPANILVRNIISTASGMEARGTCNIALKLSKGLMEQNVRANFLNAGSPMTTARTVSTSALLTTRTDLQSNDASTSLEATSGKLAREGNTLLDATFALWHVIFAVISSILVGITAGFHLAGWNRADSLCAGENMLNPNNLPPIRLSLDE